MNNKTLKIATFLDGNFFMTITEYYKFQHQRQQYLSFSGLTEFIKEEVAKSEGVDSCFCKIVETHWFRGRYNTSQLNQMMPEEAKRLKWMTNERYRDDLFMYNGIVQHVYPLQFDHKSGRTIEKGIDVWFALEAFELAILKKFDVVCLMAGDTDYVPLVRKLNGLGIRVMILGWDFNYTLQDGKIITTRTSQALLDEASYPVLMDDIINNPREGETELVNALFGA